MKRSENGNPLSMRDKELLFLKRLLRNETADAQFINGLNALISATPANRDGIATYLRLKTFNEQLGEMHYGIIINSYIQYLVGNPDGYPNFSALVLVIENLSGNTVNDEEFKNIFGNLPLEKFKILSELVLGDENRIRDFNAHLTNIRPARLVVHLQNNLDNSVPTKHYIKILNTALRTLSGSLETATNVKKGVFGSEARTLAIKSALDNYHETIRPLFDDVYSDNMPEQIIAAITPIFKFIPKFKEIDRTNLATLIIKIFKTTLDAEHSAKEVMLDVSDENLNALAVQLLELKENPNSLKKLTAFNEAQQQKIKNIQSGTNPEKKRLLGEILETKIQTKLAAAIRSLNAELNKIGLQKNQKEEDKKSNFITTIRTALEEFSREYLSSSTVENSQELSPRPASSPSTKKASFIQSVHESMSSKTKSQESGSRTLSPATSTKSATTRLPKLRQDTIAEVTTPLEYLIRGSHITLESPVGSFTDLYNVARINEEAKKKIISFLNLENIHNMTDLAGENSADLMRFFSLMVQDFELSTDLGEEHNEETLLNKLSKVDGNVEATSILLNIMKNHIPAPLSPMSPTRGSVFGGMSAATSSIPSSSSSSSKPRSAASTSPTRGSVFGGLRRASSYFAPQPSTQSAFNTFEAFLNNEQNPPLRGFTGRLEAQLQKTPVGNEAMVKINPIIEKFGKDSKELKKFFAAAKIPKDSQKSFIKSYEPSTNSNKEVSSLAGGEATEQSANISKWRQKHNKSQLYTAAPLAAIKEGVPARPENEDSERRPSTSVSKTDAKSLEGKDKDGKGGDEGASR